MKLLFLLNFGITVTFALSLRDLNFVLTFTNIVYSLRRRRRPLSSQLSVTGFGPKPVLSLAEGFCVHRHTSALNTWTKLIKLSLKDLAELKWSVIPQNALLRTAVVLDFCVCYATSLPESPANKKLLNSASSGMKWNRQF